jgi:hypothetical protein
MEYDSRMQAAISDLESQYQRNFAATAKKWNLKRTTPAKRFKGEMGPNRDATSYTRRQLTDI